MDTTNEEGMVWDYLDQVGNKRQFSEKFKVENVHNESGILYCYFRIDTKGINHSRVIDKLWNASHNYF